MTCIAARAKVFIPLLLLALASCGDTPPAPPLTGPIPGGTPVAVQPVAPQQRHPDAFDLWVADFRNEAMSKGITKETLDRAFAIVHEPEPKIVQSDQKQPEKTITFEEYSRGFLSPRHLEAAREQWKSRADILNQVHQVYGVPIPIMLALWQTESRFGENQGKIPVVQSLATLAYNGRRADFFRSELIKFLTIVQEQGFDPATLNGSWAGAMGQVQFMPSSYLSFAVDFDGDGRKDIWHSEPDALASMANYLSTRGWNSEIGWGIHVRVPRHGDVQEWVDSKQKHTYRQWARLGIRRAGGGALPQGDYELRLVMPDYDPDNAYLVTSNYDVIMDWNHSVYFATTICLEADALASEQE